MYVGISNNQDHKINPISRERERARASERSIWPKEIKKDQQYMIIWTLMKNLLLVRHADLPTSLVLQG